MKMKAEELYELRIDARLTQKELATHPGVDQFLGRLKDSQITLCLCYRDSSSPAPLLSRSSGAYVNLQKVPMTGTSLGESLNMRNLTRFLCLGIARLMGKNTRKRRQYYILSDVALSKAPGTEISPVQPELNDHF